MHCLAATDSMMPICQKLLVPFLLFSLKIPESLASQETAIGARHETRIVTGLGVAWVFLDLSEFGEPYREYPIYKLNSFIEGVPAFKGIYTTSIKNNMVNHIIEMVKENDIEPVILNASCRPKSMDIFCNKSNT